MIFFSWVFFFYKCHLEFFHCKNYFNLREIFVFMQFKMVANRTKWRRLKQKSVIQFLVTGKCKLYKIYRRMCHVYREVWDCRILRLLLRRGINPPPNECTGYDTKQSDGEASVLLELWGMQSTLSLQSLLVLLWPGVIAPDRGLSMG